MNSCPRVKETSLASNVLGRGQGKQAGRGPHHHLFKHSFNVPILAQISSLASTVSCVPESETPQIQILKKMVLPLKQNNGNEIVTSVSRVDIGIQRGAVKLHLQMNHSVPPFL